MSVNDGSTQNDSDDQGEEVVQCSGDPLKELFETYYSKGKVYLFPDVVKPSLGDKETFQRQEDDESVAYKVSEDKLEKGKGKLKGDDSEWKVLKLMKEALEDMEEPGDPPAFILHGQHLDDGKESEQGTAKKSEKDAFVLHRRLGIVVVEVKAVDNPKSRSRFEKAAKQVMDARNSLLKHLKDRVREEAVTMVMVFPNLKPENADDVRKASKDKPDNPKVEILCGQDVRDYQGLLQNIWNPTADPFCPASARTGSEDSGDSNYRASVDSFCSVPRYGEAVKECAHSRNRWLLTKNQMEIRDADDDFVHIYGSPGTGKTLLLLHKARCWLKDEGSCVAIVIGRSFRDTLLAQLGREALGVDRRNARDRLFLCRNAWELWGVATNLEPPGRKLRVIIDELGSYSREFVSRAIVLMKQEELIESAWSADLVDSDDEWYEEATRCDVVVRRHRLTDCLRCSDDVMGIVNALSKLPYQPTVVRNQLPLPRTFATETEIIIHADHRDEQGLEVPYTECSTCRTKLQDIFRTLDLIDPVGQGQLDWRDCIILHTGRYISKKKLPTLVQWLQGLGIPAEYDKSMSWKDRFSPVSLPCSSPCHSAETIAQTDDSGLESLFSSTALSEDDTSDQCNTYTERVSTWRERVLTGKSKERKQTNVVHLMDSGDFLGLEQALVIMVHIDDRDEDVKLQSDLCKTERSVQHKRWWYNAITRCQGKLVVLALTPSPALQSLRPIRGSVSE